MNIVKSWIEAMRLRTLPVSIAGVVFASGIAVSMDSFKCPQAIMSLLFAILAQIASNFANEYFDFRDGLDRPGREGPRRGVTEGDITPRAMLAATFVTLSIACALGISLVALYGTWWMYIIGIATAFGVIAYSAGPYPLSRHCLGEIAVITFFGIIPVTLTCRLMMPQITLQIFLASVGIGLMGANVLIINNYRDIPDDTQSGKNTLAVILGPKAMVILYAINGLAALALTAPLWFPLGLISRIIAAAYLAIHLTLTLKIPHLKGRQLNPMLGLTSLAMLLFAAGYLVAAFRMNS